MAATQGPSLRPPQKIVVHRFHEASGEHTDQYHQQQVEKQAGEDGSVSVQSPLRALEKR